MLKSDAHRSPSMRGVTVRIRRLEAVFRWIGAGLLVGVVSGAAFGAGYVVITDGLGAAWFGALIGANFGLILGAPFGLALGFVNAALPSPAPVRTVIATIRVTGVVLLMSAGYWLSQTADGIWLVVAAVGAVAGWLATPTVVWASVEPHEPNRRMTTEEPSPGAEALTPQTDKLGAVDRPTKP